MNGKEKCKELKEIRRKIAENNDIEFVVSECKHQGECMGTCPKCESELRYLEKQLELKKSVGKTVAVAGIAVGMVTCMTGCNPLNVFSTVGDTLRATEEMSGAIENYTSEDDNGNNNDANKNNSTEANSETEELVILDGDVVYVPDSEDLDEETEEID